MHKTILTVLAITAGFGMAACSPSLRTRSDLELIQNQLDASYEKLEQLSQQMALIQMLVDTHQRTLQDLKSSETAGAGSAPLEGTPEEPRPPSAAPGQEAGPAAPELEPAEVTVPGASLEPSVPESPRAPSTHPEGKSPQALTPVKAPNPLYEDAMEVFRSGDYESAAALFEAFVEAFPEDDLSDNALYWAGECKYTKKKFSEAIARFKRVVEEYPAGSKVPDALLKIGFAHFSLGDMGSAESYLKQVIAQYPFSPAAAKAEERLKTLQKD